MVRQGSVISSAPQLENGGTKAVSRSEGTFKNLFLGDLLETIQGAWDRAGNRFQLLQIPTDSLEPQEYLPSDLLRFAARTKFQEKQRLVNDDSST